MDIQTLDRLISNGDADVLKIDVSSLTPQDFLPLEKYLRDDDEDRRLLAVNLLLRVNQPWCYDLERPLLWDSEPAVAVAAAAAIERLQLADKKDDLYDLIARLSSGTEGGDPEVPEKLLRTLGRVETQGGLPRILALEGHVARSDLRDAFQSVRLRLGDRATKEQVVAGLRSRKGPELASLLDAIRYGEDESWIPTLRPLLLDESTIEEIDRGEGRPNLCVRVCDRVAMTILAIDPKRRVTLRDRPYGLLTTPELEEVRTAYGVK